MQFLTFPTIRLPLPSLLRARRPAAGRTPTLPAGAQPPPARPVLLPAPSAAYLPAPAPLAQHGVLVARATRLADDARARLGFWAGHGIEGMTATGGALLLPVTVGLALAGAPLAAMVLFGVCAAIVVGFLAVGIVVESVARRRLKAEIRELGFELDAVAAEIASARARAETAGATSHLLDLARASRRVEAARAALAGGAGNMAMAALRGAVPGAAALLAATCRRVAGACRRPRAAAQAVK